MHEHKNQLLGVKSLTRAQIWNTNSTSQVLKVLSHSAISIREGRGRNRKREREGVREIETLNARPIRG